ncbi:hypothetical protein PC116_g15094 [Phytophthora cactorum]|nr:hypothetical protein Pcac1_g15768 [Phytophthora cactorum]KAG2834687.1 hypothetical protein PC111_g5724 [Phytophthora cactorum]KAG2861573.1 hypothetical protein PC113_g7046 [Phytophthora cactorum]KAG2902569.1 hypothetical protein PC115_g15542 [Phytophthora cactorum]KAG2918482.1 hypothetical protein PC117_g17054 [Phytophthora cactorum]
MLDVYRRQVSLAVENATAIKEVHDRVADSVEGSDSLWEVNMDTWHAIRSVPGGKTQAVHRDFPSFEISCAYLRHHVVQGSVIITIMDAHAGAKYTVEKGAYQCPYCNESKDNKNTLSKNISRHYRSDHGAGNHHQNQQPQARSGRKDEEASVVSCAESDEESEEDQLRESCVELMDVAAGEDSDGSEECS